MTSEEIRQAFQAVGKDHPVVNAMLYMENSAIESCIYELADQGRVAEEESIRHVIGVLSHALEVRDTIKGAVNAGFSGAINAD